jgi:flagellar hook-associated protein 1 FlgK
MNGILSSALTALQTNAAALRVVSNNVANLNTEGYARRVVQQQALSVGGQIAGVDIAEVRRVVDQFLNQESLSANAASARYGAQSDIYSQLSGFLGAPGDGTSLTSQLDKVFAAFSQASLAPTTNASQQGILNAFQNLAATISSTADSLSGLRAQIDQQVSSSVGSVNTLIKQIYSLNADIANATARGDTATAMLDQRDTALSSLAELMGIRTSEMPDGRLTVMTTDGVNLVGDMYAQLSYGGGALNGNYASIGIQNVNPATGAVIGNTLSLNAHLSSGKLKGMLDMRDVALPALQGELGNLAQQTAYAFNAQHNANTAFPPPPSLTGRNTGLLGSDALNFTGKTTIAIADANGGLVSRVTVDFDAGMISIDGGAPSIPTGSTVGELAAALNTALAGKGTASFANGVLSLTASGGNGLVVQDDAAAPSNRGGAGFSQFFGLNDLLQSAAPSIKATGIKGTDDSGFAAGQTLSFSLHGADGSVARQASITTTAGMTIGDVIAALNTAMGGAASFALAPDGTLAMTPSAGNSGTQLDISNDTTSRGTTGLSFSQLFGLGTQQLYAQAQNFSVNAAIVKQPARIAMAQGNIGATPQVGDAIVSNGDTRGLIALQGVSDTRRTFQAIGTLGAQTSTLGDYAAAFYQDVSTRSNAAASAQTAQGDRLTEVKTRQSSVSGVNLDEELSNMMLYQQAYAAGARMLQVVNQLYDTLFQIQ